MKFRKIISVFSFLLMLEAPSFAVRWCEATSMPNTIAFYPIKFICLLVNVVFNSPLLFKILLYGGTVLVILIAILKKLKML